MGRRLLRIVVYDKRCRIGGTLSLDDLAETSEVGDWLMPDDSMELLGHGEPGLADRRGRCATPTTAALGAADLYGWIC